MIPALERAKAKTAWVVPILLRQTAGLKYAPFSELEMLPRKNKAIASSKETLLEAVAEEIIQLIEALT